MDCRDVGKLADSFVAGEVPQDTRDEILRHAETCSTCAADLAARRALRESVRRAVKNSPDLAPRPEFVEALRRRLQNDAKEMSARRRGNHRVWLALAATILLAAGAGLIYLGRAATAEPSALVRAAVGAHRNCALQVRLAHTPMSIEEAAGRYGAWLRALERLPADDVTTSSGPAHVLERHVCGFRGQRFAHIILEYRNQRVSLLVAADAPRAGSDIASKTRIDDMSIASFQSSDHVALLVGGVANDDLVALARAVEAALNRELSKA